MPIVCSAKFIFCLLTILMSHSVQQMQSADWISAAIKDPRDGRLYPPVRDNCCCSICVDESNGASVLTPCGHAYHTKCLLEWCIRCTRPTCPSCRAGLDARWIWSYCGMENILWPASAHQPHNEIIVEAREWLPVYLRWNDIQEWQSIAKRWGEEPVVCGRVTVIHVLAERKWIAMVTVLGDMWNKSISDPSLRDTVACGLQMLRTSIRQDNAFMGEALPLAVTLLVMTHLRPSDGFDIVSMRRTHAPDTL